MEFWERQRAAFLNKTPRQPALIERKAESVDVEEVIRSLYGDNTDGRLPRSLRLGQLIDVLTDIWEGNGLYD